MFQRVFWGIVMALVAAVVFFVDIIYVRLAFVLFLMLASQHEMIFALRSSGYKPYAWPGYVFSVAVVLVGYLLPFNAVWLVWVATVIATSAFTIFTTKKIGTMDIPALFSSLVPLIYPMVFYQVILWAALMPNPYWRTILLGGVGIACLTDTIALFGGMAFGKHKMAPHISPKKTWEGAISGLLGGVIASVLLFAFQWAWGSELPLWLCLIAGVVTSAAGQLGDLTASGIKRHADIKDFSHLIPGHGGILDRLDSILFAVPVFMFFVVIQQGLLA